MKQLAAILLLAVSLFALATDNLSLGTPGPADCIVDRTGYALGYIEAHEQPAWVIYRMTRDEAVTKAAKRSNKFKPDPAISTGSASPSDYTKSGFDRGHLAPAADMAFSVQTMEDSFYMSNMSPQRPGFNRGVWKDLEAQVRAFAVAEGDIYVVTGPIFSGATMTIGANNVTVPQYYYKVVYDTTPPEKMIGFILPNEGSDRSLSSFAVTVDAVENATGLDFFSALPKEKQEQLESTITIDAWNWIPRQASYRSGSREHGRNRKRANPGGSGFHQVQRSCIIRPANTIAKTRATPPTAPERERIIASSAEGRNSPPALKK